jgi:hypothetical protein
MLKNLMFQKSLAIARVCAALEHESKDHAASLLKRDYPFAPNQITKRKYGPLEASRVWVRDGFVDRYTSERLVFPAVLRVLSIELPDEFPFHPNWRTDLTHPAYWELAATVDHVVPVSRGGRDDESNWVSTSMARNSAKGNWNVEELAWTLQPIRRLPDWDGLLRWSVGYTGRRPQLLTNAIRQWRRAAVTVLAQEDLTRCAAVSDPDICVIED